MKCARCGSENYQTEKSPNGSSTCLDCGYRWPNGKPNFELPAKALITEIQKIHLEPGDDLIVKLRGEMEGPESLASLKEMLENAYPSNRVMLFYLPAGCDIDFSVIKKI